MKGNVISRSHRIRRSEPIRSASCLTIDQISVSDVFWMGPLQQIEDGEF